MSAFLLPFPVSGVSAAGVVRVATAGLKVTVGGAALAVDRAATSVDPFIGINCTMLRASSFAAISHRSSFERVLKQRTAGVRNARTEPRGVYAFKCAA